MKASLIESWSIGRSEAAEIVGLSAIQIGNYLKRYDLFPERPRGKGHHASFKLRDLLKLAAVKALIGSGLSPEEATSAFRGNRGPYSAMLTDGYGPDREPLFTYPGTMFFTRNSDGQWVAADGPDRIVCIQIRCWPLFDSVWPKVRARILYEGTFDPAPYPGDVEAEVLAFEERIAALRAERWGETSEINSSREQA